MAVKIKQSGVTIGGSTGESGKIYTEGDVLSEDTLNANFVQLLRDGDPHASSVAEIVDDSEIPVIEPIEEIAEEDVNETEESEDDSDEGEEENDEESEDSSESDEEADSSEELATEGPLADPGSFNVEQVVEALKDASPEQEAATKAAEAAGQNRKGIVEHGA